MMSPTTASIPSNIQSLVDRAKDLYDKSFSTTTESDRPIAGSLHLSTAPGRVNLIGEHTDYTGGFVLPLAIGYGTVCCGRGSVIDKRGDECGMGNCRVVSANDPADIVAFRADPSAVPSATATWANYVMGVVMQYLPDLPDGKTLTFDMAVAGDVPLGSGLSSSASLEVAAAVFLEAIVNGEGGVSSSYMKLSQRDRKKERAVRCQRAENVFCGVPCGIMVCALVLYALYTSSYLL